jgi:hypothetical protein
MTLASSSMVCMQYALVDPAGSLLTALPALRQAFEAHVALCCHRLLLCHAVRE